jgi:predicted NodU family carbamoyl transferase
VAKILGIVTETHDSGLALLDDGMPPLVLEEERFNRPAIRWNSRDEALEQAAPQVDVFRPSADEQEPCYLQPVAAMSQWRRTYGGRGNRLECRWRGGFFDSLGMLYTLITRYLGFNHFEEGAVMALVAGGGDTYVAKFREVVRLRDGGQFSLNSDYLRHDRYGAMRPFTRRFLEAFGPPRQRDEAITDRHGVDVL